MNSDSFDIGKNRDYILAHYDRPKRTPKGKYDYEERNDDNIKVYYQNKIQSNNLRESDVGLYCLGFCWSLEENYTDALDLFKKVRDERLKYLSNSIGYIYRQQKNLKTAELYFRKEINNNRNIEGAYENLSEVLYEERKFKELDKWVKDDSISRYISYNTIRKVDFIENHYLHYYILIFTVFANHVNSFGFLGAFIIFLSWLFYLRRLDIYEPEKWFYIVLVSFGGMILSFNTFLISDMVNEKYHFNINGGMRNDFIYCIFGIGAVEELVKIIPFVCLLAFSKVINEPIDYIIYGSASALGFAFIENLLYFNENSLYIMHGRALCSVLSHMFNSSVIAYGLMLYKYKWKKHLIPIFIASFLVASISHGFFDFWLINKKVSSADLFIISGSLISIIYMLCTFFIYMMLISIALKASPFYTPGKSLNELKLRNYLLLTMSSVFLFEYYAQAFKHGAVAANYGFLSTIRGGAYLLFFITARVSTLIKEDNDYLILFSFLKLNSTKSE